MILLLFKLILITSILVLAYTIASQKKMLLYPIRQWAMEIRDNGNKWIEAFFICHLCQPSVWGLLGYSFAYGLDILNGFQLEYVVMYPLVVGGSSIVNAITWGTIRFIGRANKFLKWATSYFKYLNRGENDG